MLTILQVSIGTKSQIWVLIGSTDKRWKGATNNEQWTCVCIGRNSWRSCPCERVCSQRWKKLVNWSIVNCLKSHPSDCHADPSDSIVGSKSLVLQPPEMNWTHPHWSQTQNWGNCQLIKSRLCKNLGCKRWEVEEGEECQHPTAPYTGSLIDAPTV